MSITRRQFLLGTTAGLILPSFYERAYSFFENHGEPLLIVPKRTGEILYACSEYVEEGFRLNLGDPEREPPEMTIREFCAAFGEGDLDTWWRENWFGTDDTDPIKWDAQMDPWSVEDWWSLKYSSHGAAYHYLESLDLGPQLKGHRAAGGLDFYCGGSPGNSFLAVDAMDEVSLSLLQQRLNELGSGLEVRLY
jgi:hypothetical protein